MSRKCKYSENDLERAIKHAKCIKDVMINLGMKVNNGGYRIIHSYAIKYNLELPRFSGEEQVKQAKLATKIPDEEYFNINTYHSGSHIRKRLIKDHKREEKCAVCGIGTKWNNKFLRFQVDHIDGNRFNNTLTNLRFLCPNCHSQTETFGNSRKTKQKYNYCSCGVRICKTSKQCLKCANKSPKKKKIKWPSDKEILDLVNNYSFLQAGKILGVSDNAIRKHLKRQGLPIPRRRSKNVTMAE